MARHGRDLIYRKRASPLPGAVRKHHDKRLNEAVSVRFGEHRDGTLFVWKMMYDPKSYSNSEAKDHSHGLPDVELIESMTDLPEAARFYVKLREDFGGIDAPSGALNAPPPRVDRAKNRIHGMLLCGLESLNRRSYQQALSRPEAPTLYDGRPANSNHVEDGESVKWEDRLGSWDSPRFVEGAGMFGDLAYNPKHPSAEALLWFAEHGPSMVGNSHRVNAIGRRDKGSGHFNVEQIERVLSVDVVADPATTKGFFESACDASRSMTTEDFLATVRAGTKLGALSFAKARFQSRSAAEGWARQHGFDPGNVTETENAWRLGETLAGARVVAVADGIAAELGEEPKHARRTRKERTMEFDDITLEELTRKRPDIVNAVLESKAAKDQVKALEAERDAEKKRADEAEKTRDDLVAEKKAEDRKVEIAKLLDDAKVPKELRTALLIDTLTACEDDDKVKEHIQALAGTKVAPTKSTSKSIEDQRGVDPDRKKVEDAGGAITTSDGFAEAANARS